MTRVDLLGWVALASSLTGLVLLARGDRRGWIARLGSGAFWILFAVAKHLPVYVVTSALYIGIDAYGFFRSRTRKPRPVSKSALVRIHGEPRGPINLWTEH